MDRNRKNRRRKRVRINYPRLIISICVMLLVIFLLFSGVRAVFRRVFPKKPAVTTEEKTETDDTSTKNSPTIEGELSQNSKIEDFDYISKLIESTHPYFEENIHSKKIDWKKITEDYKNKVSSSENDAEFITAISEYVNELGDEQTHIVSYDFYNYLNEKYTAENKTQWLSALNLDLSKARYALLAADKIDNIISNQSTTTGSNLSLETPITGQLALIKVESFDESFKSGDAKSIRDFLGTITDYKNLVIDISEVDEGVNSYWIENLVSPLISSEVSFAGRIAKKNDEFKSFLDYSYKNKHSYLTFGDEFPISELPLELNVESYVRENFKTYKRFDITVEPSSPVDFEGRIFLLQGPKVYGAADTFSQFSKSTGFATVVGKATRGYGMTAEIDPVLVNLPNSGLILRMPAVMGLNYDGSSTAKSGTKPDIEITKDIIDYKEIMDFIN